MPSRRWSGSTRPACCACNWATTCALQVRPSGTEPKVKLYGEGIDCEPAEFLEALAALLA